jgi:hypothetical protein
MPDPERPDLNPLRRQLGTLVLVIALVVAFLLWLTFHLYGKWTAGVQVTP